MRFVGLLSLLLMCCCAQGTADGVVAVASDDLDMEQAIAQAKATVSEFIVALETRDPADYGFAVKAPIRDGDHVEHFWLVDVAYENGDFLGFIGNEPQRVKSVVEGQPYSIAATEISDWMFIRDGTAIGNRTLVAMFPQMPVEEVAAVKQQLGWE